MARTTRRRTIGLLLAAAALVAVTLGAAASKPQAATASRHPNHYTIGLFGDMPYGQAGQDAFPALLADMNAHRLAFSVFDGDLKAGGDGPCDAQLYTSALAHFNSLRAPLILTPGDNDWTDCWGRYGPGTGGWDPEGRLNHERKLFFSTDQSLGQRTLTVDRESYEGGQYAPYSENARWVLGPVVYVTVNVQGSNDNYAHLDNPEDVGSPPYVRSPAEIARQDAEHEARLAADLHWLDDSFAYATRIGAKGILIDWQADPNFNNELHLDNPDEYDGFPPYLNELRALTIAFSGQVVLVHGDSHYFKVDKPLLNDAGSVLANFTRVETFGAANTDWVAADIDPRDPNLFEFRPMIVPAG